jgi:hypothetical protein
MTSVGDEQGGTATRARRARPMLSAPLPDRWVYKESLTLLAEDATANVIASSEPVAADMDVKKYAEVQGALLKQFRRYKELSLEPAYVFGRGEGFIRVFEWTPVDAPPVTQIQMYYVENGRGFTATATANSADFANLQVTLTDVAFGLSIDDSSGEGLLVTSLAGVKTSNEATEAETTSA